MRKCIIICLTFLLAIAMVCSTILWVNHNSWTLRFEMDDNTLQAIESVEYPIINEYQGPVRPTTDEEIFRETGVSQPN